jgi:RNA polymerase sigma-70 factor (ECF subfamily)
METIMEQPSLQNHLDGEVWNAISNLEEKYRILVYLHYYEGYKTEEIAGMLGINHATIRTRLRVAKAKLRLILEEDNYAFE